MKIQVFFLAVLAVAIPAARGSVLYSNGGIPSTAPQGWGIFGTSQLADTFVLTGPATATSVTFGEMIDKGGTPLTVDWEIGSAAFGSDFGSASGVTETLTLFCSASPTCGINFYDVYSATFTLNVPLNAGNYWLTLGDATFSNATRVFWVQNGGPSQAIQSVLGPLASEAFEIDGTTAPEPASFALAGAGLLLVLLSTRAVTARG
jgi:hypothetical protein